MKANRITFYTILHAAVILLGLAILISGLTSCSPQMGLTGFYETPNGGRVEVTYKLPNRIIKPTK